jgi:hypothetical protein
VVPDETEETAGATPGGAPRRLSGLQRHILAELLADAERTRGHTGRSMTAPGIVVGGRERSRRLKRPCPPTTPKPETLEWVHKPQRADTRLRCLGVPTSRPPWSATRRHVGNIVPWKQRKSRPRPRVRQFSRRPHRAS